MLVYLGEVPKYVIANLNYLIETFPEREVVLVTNRPIPFGSSLSSKVSTWSIPEEIGSWGNVMTTISHDPKFRNNFWYSTVARFYFLLHYMKQNAVDSVLHIEADVWLSSHFPMKSFFELGKVIAYPLKSDTEGIASTFYVGSIDLMERFAHYCEQEFLRDPFSTDVSILGNYPKLESAHFVNLPTGINHSKFFQDYVSVDLARTLSGNFERFMGLFDASTLGIWFTGVDPRNEKGFRVLFKEQNHPVTCSNVKLQVQGERIFLVGDAFRVEVYSLHVHSKDIRMFESKSALARLSYVSNLDSASPRYESLGLTTFRYLLTYVLYKVRMAIRLVLVPRK